MSEEYIEEWDWDSGRPAGRAVSRSLAHKTGIPHEGVHLWIVSFIEGRKHILLQRRAADKEFYPGCLDITVGGHVLFGQTEGKIQKEAREELGLSINDNDLTDLGYFRYEETVPAYDLIHREFQHIWLLHDDRPLDAYVFCDGEVDALAAVPLNEFSEILSGKEYCSAYLSVGGKTEPLTLSRSAFHPLFFSGPMDAYMSAVISAAEKICL